LQSDIEDEVDEPCDSFKVPLSETSQACDIGEFNPRVLILPVLIFVSLIFFGQYFVFVAPVILLIVLIFFCVVITN